MSTQVLRPTSWSQLAPEIILHILNHLDYQENPSCLLPILTLSKSWARLALTLLYEQPVVSFQNCSAFLWTLGLQDRLDISRESIWYPSDASGARGAHDPAADAQLGVDYRHLIKKPCRLVCVNALSRQDLTQLWDLQTILWTVPAFKYSPTSPISGLSSGTSTPKATSVSTLSSNSATSSESGTVSNSPELTHQDAFLPTPVIASPQVSRSFSASLTRVSTPGSTRAVLVRRPKRSTPPPGPVVILLDLFHVINDVVYQMLNEVPGMKLYRLDYKWILNISLQVLVSSHLGFIKALSLTRPPTRAGELLHVAQLIQDARALDPRVGIRSLKLDQCQAAGTTVLKAFAQGCGSALTTLEVRQYATMRPQGGGLATFPVDSPSDTSPRIPSSGSGSTPHPDSIAQDRQRQPGEQCVRCGHTEPQLPGHQRLSSLPQPTPSDVNTTLHGLGLSDETLGASAATEPTATLQPENEQADVDQETRMDLALVEFSQSCPKLERLRLNNVAWLSDESLVGFIPSSGTPRELDQHQLGLREIELQDSYYGSRLTIEGLLALCGPNLEELTVDRKSCWRVRVSSNSDSISPLCASCSKEVAAKTAREANMTTGDRIIFGMLEKQSKRVAALQTRGNRAVSVGVLAQTSKWQLKKLVLNEHWVTAEATQELMISWSVTLSTVSLKICECPIEKLAEALMPRTLSTSVLESLSLSLVWIRPDDPALDSLANKLFKTHPKIEYVEINRRMWQKHDQFAL
ncbi:hypothetical protein BGW38_003080 [Lunasporangiospora selenospora]|uniref:F-box domain-containing protein n=1 Tax=Lunasporangiospora selenospora TaxID=979761 RepID=A0A9P6KHU4_9FUNG|nr:hypothetical protein BGW38_003080 [Lunasporangiospora selenospora]